MAIVVGAMPDFRSVQMKAEFAAAMTHDRASSAPAAFLCPLTGAVMRDPVILSSGQTFERSFAERWLAQGHTTCPKTGAPLASTSLTPNDALRALIEEWCEKHDVILQPLSPPGEGSGSSTEFASAGASMQGRDGERNAPARRPPTAPLHGSSSSSSNGSFDLAKARAASRSRLSVNAANGALPASPRSVFERSSSFQSTSGSSTSSAGSAASLSREIAPAIPKHLRSPFNERLPIQRTLSPCHRPGPPRMDVSSPADSPSHSSAGGGRPPAAAGSRGGDSADDDALSSYLSAAEARRKQKRAPAAEPLPYSQQLLSQTATRRSRRMSCDSHVCEMRPLVDRLVGGGAAGPAARRGAAQAVRVALKDSAENRLRLVAAGGVRPLVACLGSCDAPTVEHASAALLYLALAWDSAQEVVGAGGIRALVEVLRAPTGRQGGSNTVPPAAEEAGFATSTVAATEAAKSNAAAALFALSNSEENRRLVVAAAAVPPLVRLLQEAATARARKDACLALYGAAWSSKAVEEMVALGAVAAAAKLLGDCEEGVEEKATALLAVLAKYEAAEAALAAEEDLMFALVDVLEGGSLKSAEATASCLLLLARHSLTWVEAMLAEGCLPSLAKVAACSKAGSDSRQLLQMLREHSKSRNSRSNSLAGSPCMSPFNHSTRSFSSSLVSITMSPGRPDTPLGAGRE